MSENKSAIFSLDILNAFRDNLCVLDSAGNIIAVNESWIRFAAENNGVLSKVGTGVNYLRVCDNAMGAERNQALEFAAGIRDVIAGRNQVFTMEYECSTNTEERWFSGRVTSFHDSASDYFRILIIHENIAEKRKTELELKKVSLAVEQSPSTVVITDLKGNIEYVNPKFVELTGYSLEEAIGKNPRILKSGKTPAHVYKDMWSSIKSGRIWRGTFLNKNRNDNLYWESAVISPIFNDKGEIINYMAVKEDVTDRKQAEDDLRYQALLLENVPDAIISTDINFNVKTWNRGAEELYGISEKEAVGNQLENLFATEYIANKYDDVLKEFMGAGNWQGEVVQVLKSGKRINIMSSVTLLKDSSGAPDGAVAVNRDITEKKRIEHGIMREYNLNAALSEIYEPMMKSDISIKDIAKIILYWARYLTSSEHGFVSTIDSSTGNLISHTLTEMLEGGCGMPDDKKEIVFSRDPHGKFPSLFGYSLNTGEALYTNEPAVHPASRGIPEGHIPLKNYLSVPVYVEDEIGGLIAVSNSENDYTEDDMTAVRRLAGYYAIAIKRQRDIEKLENAKLFAETANRAKSGFIASMSHELRTPLNSILGFSQLLEMKTSGELNSDQMEYVGYIRSSGSHLLEMINEILDLAKIEAGKIEIKKKPFDLAALLNGFPERMKALSLKKNITVKLSVADDIGTLDADELRIRQILFNLLSNAVKFTEPDKNIGIEAYPDESNAVITVWDEGQGIAERDHERIFSPFEQAGSMEESLKGTGLGLSITRKLVELHGGRIVLDSAPGKGSRFTFILPGRRAKVSSAE